MDALDVRILRTMGTVPYVPRPKDPDAFKTSHIAENVGTTARTVRTRLRAMEEESVILGYQILPNLAHLGLTAEGYFFVVTDEAAKNETIEAALDLPRMMAVHDFLGEGVCFEFAFTDSDERAETLGTLSKLTGDPNPRRFYDGVMPVVDRELTNLDWRILASLRWEATKRLREVAKEVGVTRRTVKRHYDRMAREGSFVPVALMDPSRATGLLLFELLFFFDPDHDRSAAETILEAYRDHYLFSYVPASEELGHFDVEMFAESPAEIARLRRLGAEFSGVERVEAWLFRRFEDHSDWIDEAIAERVEATGL